MFNKPPIRPTSVHRFTTSAASFAANSFAFTPGQVLSPEQMAVLDRMEARRKARKADAPQPTPPRPFIDPADIIPPPAGGTTGRAVQSPLASPASTTQIAGAHQQGTSIPPDTMGVLDQFNQIMAICNESVWVYDRTDPNPANFMWLDAFFTQGIANSPSTVDTFDPYVVRDPISNQYIAVALNDKKGANGVPGLFLGSTQNGQLQENWQYVWISCASLGMASNLWFDYPRIGTNDTSIAITVNVYDNVSGNYQYTLLMAIDKASYYQGSVALGTFVIDNSSTIVPARTFDTGVPLYAACAGANDQDNTNIIQLYELTGTVADNTVSLAGPVNVATDLAYNAPPANKAQIAPQEGTTTCICLDDDRIQSVVMRGGSLWLTHTVFLPVTGTVTLSGIQAYQINPANTTTPLLQAMRLADPAGVNFYAYPSIAVNSLGDVLIGIAAFNANSYPFCTYTSWGASDPLNTLRTTGSSVISNGSYTSGRWGDYSATVVDPMDDLSFWTCQEVAVQLGYQWTTYWQQVPQIS